MNVVNDFFKEKLTFNLNNLDDGCDYDSSHLMTSDAKVMNNFLMHSIS